ncbi:MAG TPA: glycine oxidase ThiO [Vicinamibacteria bacterium]|jgi:glycine oxidase
MEPRSSDAIVIGAGVVGLSAARALGRAGAKVLVVERRRIGAEASSAAAGIVSPQMEATANSPLLELALRARDHLFALTPALQEETGIDVDLGTRGLLELAFTEDEERALDERLGWQRARGLPVEPLGPEEVREAEPNVNPAVRRALFLPRDRRIDNVRLTRALAASAVARGASVLCGRPVTALLLEGGRVAGVRAGAETLRAPAVINAMGAWAALLSGDPQPPPVEPLRGHIVAFDLAPALLRHVVCSPRGYLVPRSDGRTLAGSTVERAGFDKSVTAGSLRKVLDIALELAPALADVPIAASWAGLRPGSADGLPMIGRGAVEGLFHGNGLFRNGILLGPLVGELVAELAMGRPSAVDLSAFAPARFRSEDAMRERPSA